MSATRRVLFVCLGNICRSPVGEGVLRHLAAAAGAEALIEVDSAGTSGHHEGEAYDRRAAASARARGITLVGRSRPVRAADFAAFDLLLAMDAANHRELLRRCPPEQRSKVRLLRSWDPQGPGDVPDPYYGGDQGFEDVLDMVERSCRALLAELLAELR